MSGPDYHEPGQRHAGRGWTQCGAPAAALGGLLILSPNGLAATTACPEHFAFGSAPEILRPALAAQVRELCFEGYAVLHSG
ncbi:hypothetical protein ACFQX4_27840, partial [Roseomonas sp. GCM10028921]